MGERALLPNIFLNNKKKTSTPPSSSSSTTTGEAGQHEQIVPYVLNVLRKDMAQHGLQPQVIAHAIQQRYDELIQNGFTKKKKDGKKKGATSNDDGSDSMMIDGGYVL